MKLIIKWITVLAIFMLIPIQSYAGVEDTFRGNAKFNVVITVIAIIFSGIIWFLFRMDRRISQLENQKKKTQ